MKDRWRGGLRGIAAFLLVIAAWTPEAKGQSDYYQEVPKEGRIYVFVTAGFQRAWEQSGEMGNKVISFLGYGPNGETVLFENPKALELYNARHGTKEAPPPEAPPEVKLPFNVQYRYPGLRLSFPKAEINLSSRMQIRYTHEQFDDIRTRPTPFPTTLEDRGSFRIRRMRVKFDGWIYTRDLTYELQWDLADTSGNQLQDANIDYDFTAGKKLFRLKAGQFKAPFSHQQLTSSGNQQLVDRSLLDAFFVPGRQLGVQLWGQVGTVAAPDFVDWRVGVFNGNGRTSTANDNDEFQYVARVVVSPWGGVGYSESNLEAYDFRLSFAGEFNNNDAIIQPATGAWTGTEVETFGAGVLLKAVKALFLKGQYYSGQSETGAGVETDRDGWMVQGGWLFTPKWEVACRYGVLDPNTDTDNNDQTEWRAGLSWYMNKHNWKLQADYGETENEAAAPTTFRTLKELRIQAQLIF